MQIVGITETLVKWQQFSIVNNNWNNFLMSIIILAVLLIISIPFERVFF